MRRFAGHFKVLELPCLGKKHGEGVVGRGAGAVGQVGQGLGNDEESLWGGMAIIEDTDGIHRDWHKWVKGMDLKGNDLCKWSLLVGGIGRA